MDRSTFHPHVFGPDEEFVDLYHVYDNLSKTPYLSGRGIWCGDSDQYVMHPYHVITPNALIRHSDWNNRILTQFISFFDNAGDAHEEAQRRAQQLHVPGGYRRDPNSIRIAHVRLLRGTNVWVFSRSEMLRMMKSFGGTAAYDMLRVSHPHEWYVWGDVPKENVENRNAL